MVNHVVRLILLNSGDKVKPIWIWFSVIFVVFRLMIFDIMEITDFRTIINRKQVD